MLTSRGCAFAEIMSRKQMLKIIVLGVFELLSGDGLNFLVVG